MHHAGLVVWDEERVDQGLEVWRTSFGIDVRWAGPWPGITLGVHRSLLVIPVLVPIDGDDPERLAPSVCRWFDAGELPEHTAPQEQEGTGWGVGYASDAWADQAVIAAWWAFGLDIGGTPGGGTFSLGYHAGRHLVGRALQPGHVLVDQTGAEQPRATILWSLTTPTPTTPLTP